MCMLKLQRREPARLAKGGARQEWRAGLRSRPAQAAKGSLEARAGEQERALGAARRELEAAQRELSVARQRLEAMHLRQQELKVRACGLLAKRRTNL